MNVSILPPLNPAISPRTIPTTNEIAVADDGDPQRGPRTVDRPDEHVAAELVDAHPVRDLARPDQREADVARDILVDLGGGVMDDVRRTGAPGGRGIDDDDDDDRATAM